jgi:M3 family oligoendopeptidase
MVKFSEMVYERVDLPTFQTEMKAQIAAFKAAKTADEALAVFKKVNDLNTHVKTMHELANTHKTLDTRDEYYKAEDDYWNETMPQFKEFSHEFNVALVNSPFREEMEARFGTQMFKNIEIQLKTFAPEIVPDLQVENRLMSEYQRLLSSAQIEFGGQKHTVEGIKIYFQDPDRSVRKGAIEAESGWFMAHADEFDRIYDDLVQVRTKMARMLGYENFVELGYYRMMRNAYNQEMVETFRKLVVASIVPLVEKLKAEQAQRIGVDKIMIYDDAFAYPDGNAKPMGTAAEIFAHGKQMYHELSPETAEFIDFMLDNDLFDVETRPGKMAGGYMTQFDEYRAPFVFANFNGTSHDVEVLTHEAGHAFQGYIARDYYPPQNQELTMEVAEIHSMSMEFFTYPWMEGFFGPETAKFYQQHLASTLIFIPYGCEVDHYQHIVYANPDLTPAQRNAEWLKLEKLYRPFLVNEGVPFYAGGRRWQKQLHLFSDPFYYIDYCLAQTMALYFWQLDQKDHASAWAKYRHLLGVAAKMNFVDLLHDSGLPTPFDPETLPAIAQAAAAWLAKNEQ